MDEITTTHSTATTNSGEVHAQLVQALKEVLTDGDSSPLLIKRIPFICNDIRDIKNDMRWAKYIGAGFLFAAGVLALKSLGLTI